jgi:plastocyanin
MIWLWRIAFSVVLAAPVLAADVSGAVRLSHSRISSVRKGQDYSGVVIWLDPLVAPASHAQTPPMRLTMEQKGKRFIPHVLAVPVGAKVRFPNLDPIFHSAFSNFSGQIFDFGLYPPGTSRDVEFTRPGVVRIFCNIHPSMSAIIVVLKYPWFAVSNEAGAFSIGDVPDGDYRLRVFHERATQETLDGLAKRIQVSGRNIVVPPMPISETGYLETPHKNKYGSDYPPVPGDGAYPAGRK